MLGQSSRFYCRAPWPESACKPSAELLPDKHPAAPDTQPLLGHTFLFINPAPVLSPTTASTTKVNRFAQISFSIARDLWCGSLFFPPCSQLLVWNSAVFHWSRLRILGFRFWFSGWTGVLAEEAVLRDTCSVRAFEYEEAQSSASTFALDVQIYLSRGQWYFGSKGITIFK